MKKVNRLPLLLAALALAISVRVTAVQAQITRAADYDQKLEAAQLMQDCMDEIRKCKETVGLTVSEEDIHHTGLIGAPYTMVTTTLGVLEAKRTTANPDMAALCIQLLSEAGVQPGDRVGAAFSGSFPGLNLAVLSACAVMNVDLVYISSAGASTYGANQPELTFPEMADHLVDVGLLPKEGAAVSIGGGHDCGDGMSPELRDEIVERLKSLDLEFIWERDYQANLSLRQAIYEKEGPITCFIGVGGSITTLGLAEDQMDCGVTKPYTITTITPDSGLMEIYNAEGLPVIHLLNVKRLVADYGLPYDPVQLLPPGESAIYYTTRYPWQYAMIGIIVTCVLLILGRRQTQKEKWLTEKYGRDLTR